MIRHVLPTVLNKTVFELNFIVKEVKKILNACSKMCPFPETVDVFVMGCNSKNGSLAEFSISYLADLIKVMDPSYYRECGPSVRGLF